MTWRRAVPYVLPFVLVFIAGHRCLGGGLIRDDVLYVVLNPHVSEPTPLSLTFGAPFQPEQRLGLYRPLTTLSLRIDCWLSHQIGSPPTVDGTSLFHVTNLLLAALAGIALFRLARGIGFGPVAAGVASALFVVHPARSEAVFWISGRAECLMTLFALASLAVATGGARGYRGPLAAGLAVLSFFAKEQGAVLPFLIVLLPKLERRDRVKHLAMTGGALLVAFAWRSSVIGGIGPQHAHQVLLGTSFFERIPTAVGFLGDYLRLIVWPWPLLNERDDPTSGPGVLACAFVLALAVLIVARLRKHDLRSTFAFALFLLPLGPVLNLVYRTGETFAERFLALPMAGVSLAIVIGVAALPRLGSLLLSTTILICLIVSLKRAGDFASDVALTDAMMRDAGDSAAAWRLSAGIPRRARQWALGDLRPEDALTEQSEALRRFRTAIEKNPDDYMARLELTGFLYELARPATPGAAPVRPLVEEGEGHARWVVDHVPEHYEGQKWLGLFIMLRADAETDDASRTRLLERAEPYLRRVLDAAPHDQDAAKMLVRILRRSGRTDAARAFMTAFAAIARRETEDRWWDAFGPRQEAMVAVSLGHPHDAIPHLEEALRRTLPAPQRVLIVQQLANLLKQAGRTGDAVRVVGDERKKLIGWIDTPRVQSDLMDALAQLDLLLGNRAAAADWHDRAAATALHPRVARYHERTAAALRK
ncbi:MAG: hypothetical protein CMJ83_19080 [Planctomycetes bacterium]|nr:hypothetical protein [Planctomycetota bacterium]